MAESKREAGVVSQQALSQALLVDQKQLIRDRIWHQIDADPNVRRAPGAQGRIPNFVGAEAAARGLVALREWHAARVVKSNPDSPQQSVRSAAIEAGKLLYMAVPRLTLDAPFLALSLAQLAVPAEEAANIDGAHRHGVLTRLEDVQPVDFIVCGRSR